MTTQTRNRSFDLCTLFPEFGTPNADPLPEAGEGEIVLRVPESISLQSLRDSDVGKALLHQQDWYNKYDWASTSLPAGTYRLRVPIPKSNRKTFKQQLSLLLDGEQVAPVTVVALALLCCKKHSLPDPLKDGWARCQETAGGARVALSWYDGRLYVDGGWDGYRSGLVWAAGARTS